MACPFKACCAVQRVIASKGIQYGHGPGDKLGRPGHCCEIQLNLPEGQSKEEMGTGPALHVAIKARP